jgi:hypothetical protein
MFSTDTVNNSLTYSPSNPISSPPQTSKPSSTKFSHVKRSWDTAFSQTESSSTAAEPTSYKKPKHREIREKHTVKRERSEEPILNFAELDCLVPKPYKNRKTELKESLAERLAQRRPQLDPQIEELIAKFKQVLDSHLFAQLGTAKDMTPAERGEQQPYVIF